MVLPPARLAVLDTGDLMRRSVLFLAFTLVAATFSGAASSQTPDPFLLPLDQHWQLQSSAVASAGGEAIATAAFQSSGWYAASVPSTVVGTLVANHVYPDPYIGMNLRSVPGTSYPIGNNFSRLAMPEGSPFHTSWWYRTTFNVPAAFAGKHLSLQFDGINYRANVWLNGKRIATSTEVAGTYRRYEFDVTDVVTGGRSNALAVEVFPPEPDDLAWTWVDWNPMPPDKNMGLWRGVRLAASGDVIVRAPQVVSTVASSLDRADLTVYVDVRNLATKPVRAKLGFQFPIARGSKTVSASRDVDLAPLETRVVSFAPADTPALRLTNPDLWWPAEMTSTSPRLQPLVVNASVNGTVSDLASLQFGIREITSTVTNGARQFFVNGKPIQIRGGGWAPDMLLRPDPARLEAELDYVRGMHLNTIRLEGKLEDDLFFQLADQKGILVLAGWCCCDQWEQWARWKPENRAIAEASQHDQVRRLRAHPSLLAWLNGSDNPPPADIERMYIDALTAERWPNPYVSSATARKTTVTGESGVKMTGPYDWVPPAYWLTDTKNGGAFGFNTETSPGAAVPPIESIKRMIPADHLWPIDEVWNYHAGGGQFKTLDSFTRALTARYGAPSSVDDYAMKAQLMAYEGERAMFEAYRRNAPAATGVIQWMLNNAWPGMIWHLYDYYLRPGGGYFGTRKANEPIHVMYSYDTHAVVVLNDSLQTLSSATASVRAINLDGREIFTTRAPVNLQPGARATIAAVPPPSGASATYFLDLRVSSSSGTLLASNLYWLGAKMDVLDFAKSTWYVTPVSSYADFTALSELPKVGLKSSLRREGVDATGRRLLLSATIQNPDSAIAFFVRLQVTKGPGGAEVLPVRWEDNYITLLPGESRTIGVEVNPQDLGGATPALLVSGWNVR
jgi:exo-1,4-beta-D-glucosaminidase